jgi:hypothetical protein
LGDAAKYYLRLRGPLIAATGLGRFCMHCRWVRTSTPLTTATVYFSVSSTSLLHLGQAKTCGMFDTLPLRELGRAEGITSTSGPGKKSSRPLGLPAARHHMSLTPFCRSLRGSLDLAEHLLAEAASPDAPPSSVSCRCPSRDPRCASGPAPSAHRSPMMAGASAAAAATSMAAVILGV